ncbi:cation:proton antiporter [Candidatus Woesearchaeota archaeon]|nr:cation:proton antiporter [Candidatus Woesearchaeota archaeon]
MNFLITITVCLFLAFIFSEIAYRLKMPLVLGQIFAGIIIGIPIIRNTIIGTNSGIIQQLADLGIIFLLFLAGLGVSWNKMYGARKDIILIGVFGSLVPFILGFIMMKLIGFGNVHSLIVGVCMSITSEGTKARILIELKKLNTKIGATMLGAGIIDDVLGLLMFIILTAATGHEIITKNIAYSPIEIIVFIVIIALTFKLLPRLIRFEEREEGEIKEVSLFTTVLLLCLLFAIGGMLITGTMTGSIIAAFAAGVIIQLSLKKREEMNIRKHFEIMSLAFIIPFFFIGIGMNFNFSNIALSIPIIIIITITAIAGKLLGVLLTKPFSKLSWKQLHLIGWAMNSRGAVELVIALLALRAGLLTPMLYSAILIMTIITTLMFPIILRKMIKKHPHIMG